MRALRQMGARSMLVITTPKAFIAANMGLYDKPPPSVEALSKIAPVPKNERLTYTCVCVCVSE